MTLWHRSQVAAKGPAVLFLAAATLAQPAELNAQLAPTASRLTLPEAVEQALDYYPSVGTLRFVAEGAASAANGVAAARWPRLSLSASAIRFEEPMLVTPIHGFTPSLSPPFDRDLFQGAAGLRYTIFDGLGRGARIGAARAGSEAAALAVTDASQGLAARVSATYLGVLGRARVLEAHERRVDALDEEAARVRLLLEVGRAADVDLMRVEAAIAEAQAQRVSFAAALEVGERELSRLTGIPFDGTRAAVLGPATLGDRVVPSRETLLAAALQANPVVLGDQRRVAAAEAVGASARSERWPRVDLAANYLGWASAQDDPIGEWNAGVVVSWSLFTGGAVTHQIRRTSAEASAARERLRLSESNAAEELDRTLSSIREAQARIVSLELAVARSEEVARIEQLRLDAGSGVQRDYLDAEAGLFANRAALVQARHAEILGRVTLARVTGALDVEWLAKTLGGTP